jgi:hypothetical protein
MRPSFRNIFILAGIAVGGALLLSGLEIVFLTGRFSQFMYLYTFVERYMMLATGVVVLSFLLSLPGLRQSTVTRAWKVAYSILFLLFILGLGRYLFPFSDLLLDWFNSTNTFFQYPYLFLTSGRVHWIIGLALYLVGLKIFRAVAYEKEIRQDLLVDNYSEPGPTENRSYQDTVESKPGSTLFAPVQNHVILKIWVAAAITSGIALLVLPSISEMFNPLLLLISLVFCAFGGCENIGFYVILSFLPLALFLISSIGLIYALFSKKDQGKNRLSNLVVSIILAVLISGGLLILGTTVLNRVSITPAAVQRAERTQEVEHNSKKSQMSSLEIYLVNYRDYYKSYPGNLEQLAKAFSGKPNMPKDGGASDYSYKKSDASFELCIKEETSVSDCFKPSESFLGNIDKGREYVVYETLSNIGHGYATINSIAGLHRTHLLISPVGVTPVDGYEVLNGGEDFRLCITLETKEGYCRTNADVAPFRDERRETNLDPLFQGILNYVQIGNSYQEDSDGNIITSGGLYPLTLDELLVDAGARPSPDPLTGKEYYSYTPKDSRTDFSLCVTYETVGVSCYSKSDFEKDKYGDTHIHHRIEVKEPEEGTLE